MIIECTGDNADLIVSEMNSARGGESGTVLFADLDFPGTALHVSQRLQDGQVVRDRWRVPVGCRINTATGEVTDADGVAQAWETLCADAEVSP